MKTLMLLVFLSLVFSAVFGQKNKTIQVPLQSAHWVFEDQQVEFSSTDGLPSMKLLSNTGKVVLKDINSSARK